MERATVNGVELEYELTGSGEPVLLIDPVLMDAFLPLRSQRALADRHQLISYHKRGWGGSTHSAAPVDIEQHAADAAALLDHLGVRRAHVAGHSSGATIALQLAFDRPALVHSLSLLEPSFFTVPSAAGFFEAAGPAFERYTAGDREEALAMFMSAVSGLDWNECRSLLETRIPGSLARTLADVDTLFAVELPSLTRWSFGAEQAAAIRQPVLSVLGGDTHPLWVEVAGLLRSWFPQVEDQPIADAGHLLQVQQPGPVARSIAEFLRRHPLSSEAGSEHRARTSQSGAPPLAGTSR